VTSTPTDYREAAPDVRDLDASAVLDAVVERRRAADQAEADLLALAVHWGDLHPVTDEHPAATVPTQRAGGLAAALGPRFFDPAPLAGDGTPAVAEYASEELAAALGLSHTAGLSLVAEAVELCYRLPRLWGLVQDGMLQAWKARQVAKATTMLSRDAVAFVDRHLAVTGRHNRLPVLNPVIHEARLRCDTDQALAVEQNALNHRGVWLDHRESTATTLLTARMDTLDALDLDATVTDLAGVLGRLGDDRHLDIRRASALGMLAHPQRALDLATGTYSECRGEARAGAGLNGSRGTLYLHVTLADLALDGDETGIGSGQVETLGSASLTLLHDWLQRLSGVSIRPVLDAARTDAVDAHDPPAWMREAVILRDRHCVFPGCTTDARACLRPRPSRPLRPSRRRWFTGPDQPGEPRMPVPKTPPGQDFRRLALPPPPGRRRVAPAVRPARSDVRVDQPTRPQLPRHAPLSR
jgi:hypothetical protein